MYYNTTNLVGEGLNNASNKAASQTLIILKFFIAHPHGMYTPIEVHRALGEKFLLTSVRRSISGLTQDDYLIKTEIKSLETYGSVNFKWRFNMEYYPQAPQLKLF